ncbi:MAG: hypothetical protein WBA13_18180 [Microcoleaceae cyanobacterium]
MFIKAVNAEIPQKIEDIILVSSKPRRNEKDDTFFAEIFFEECRMISKVDEGNWLSIPTLNLLNNNKDIEEPSIIMVDMSKNVELFSYKHPQFQLRLDQIIFKFGISQDALDLFYLKEFYIGVVATLMDALNDLKIINKLQTKLWSFSVKDLTVTEAKELSKILWSLLRLISNYPTTDTTLDISRAATNLIRSTETILGDIN